MLICPQCQFENPDTNNFCQECGVSLTQTHCSACGTTVTFDQAQCPHCGAVTGSLWWAILLPQTATSPSPLLKPTDFLDAHKRYQILEVLTSPAPEQETWLQVLDTQPLKPSYLAAVLDQSVGSEVPTLALPGPAVISPERPTSPLPAIAEIYLALQAEQYHILPNLQDAWKTVDYSVLLLEDRTHFTRLVDHWQDPEIPALQRLHWLHELLMLWQTFTRWHCQPSLLDLDNLRIDEDQVLCLQRLHPTTHNPPLDQAYLGQLWQSLWDHFAPPELASLQPLIQDLQQGKFTTLAPLEAELTALAEAHHAPWDSREDQTASELVETSHTAASSPEPSFPSLEPATIPVETAAFSLAQMGISEAPTRVEPPEEDWGESDSSSDDMPTIVLPMQLFSLDDAGQTDVGRQRNHNEDYYGVYTEVIKQDGPTGRTAQARGMYILCDGMGGHAGGEVASAMAVETLRQYFQSHWFSSPLPANNAARKDAVMPTEETIREAIHLANQAIFDLNQQQARSGNGRMGTTLVLVLIWGTQVAVSHVGDSRLYRLSRRRGLEQVTSDHDVGQREIQRGVEPAIAYARPDAYQLTQALGPRNEDFIHPDVQFFDINEDTLLLLCSDGLTDNDLVETYWRTHLEPLLSSQANLERGVSQLIDLANQYNGHDNITAMVIRIKVRPNLDPLRGLT